MEVLIPLASGLLIEHMGVVRRAAHGVLIPLVSGLLIENFNMLQFAYRKSLNPFSFRASY